MNLARKRLARRLFLVTMLPTVSCVVAYAVAVETVWSHLLASDRSHAEVIELGKMGATLGLGVLLLALAIVAVLVTRALTAVVSELVGAAQREVDTAQAERRVLARRIQHVQALTLVGQVAASLAHEIGSPLNTILGWARLAAHDQALDGAVRERFELIAQQSERITRIVQRMMETARPAGAERTAVDVAAVAREVLAFLAPDALGRGIVTSVEVAPGLPTVSAVRDEVLQLVLNLAMNALQAQPEGGRLVVRLEKVPFEHGRTALRIDVDDAGPGIDEARRAQVFEPYYSTKREGGGHGLGLSIVADIVRELGGRIEIGVAPEGGARFRVHLLV